MKVDLHFYASTVEYDFDDSTTVGDLKKAVEEKAGLPAEQQHWIHQGRPVNGDDNKTLVELGVRDGGKMHFVIPIKAG